MSFWEVLVFFELGFYFNCVYWIYNCSFDFDFVFGLI